MWLSISVFHLDFYLLVEWANSEGVKQILKIMNGYLVIKWVVFLSKLSTSQIWPPSLFLYRQQPMDGFYIVKGLIKKKEEYTIETACDLKT